MNLIDATERATEKVKSYLKSEEDLALVEDLKRTVSNQKKWNEASVKGVTRTQLENMMFIIGEKELIQDSRENILQSRENDKEPQEKGKTIVQAIQKIEELCENSQKKLPQYPQLRKLIRAQQSLSYSLHLVESLDTLEDRIRELNQRIFKLQDNLVISKDFLKIHRELFELENIRDVAIASFSNGPGPYLSEFATLTHKLREIDIFAEKFHRRLWTIAKNLLRVVRKDPPTIVKLIAIIEVEEKADLKAELEEPRTVRKLREKFFSELRQQIEERFESTIASFDIHEEDALAQAITDVNFINEELILIQDDVVQLFPPSYKIFDFYVEAYHENVTFMIKRFLETKASHSPRDILTLFGWVEDYYTNLRERLGVEEQRLKPKLLAEEREILNVNYLNQVKERVGEWAHNIMVTEAKDFRLRKEPPELEKNIYITSSPVILFKMLNQQVDIAQSTSDELLHQRFALVLKEILSKFQKEYVELIDLESKKYFKSLGIKPSKESENRDEDENDDMPERISSEPLDENENEVPGGFLEYLIAAINVQFKCHTFTGDLIERFRNILKTNSNVIENELWEIERGFTSVASFGRKTLLDVIFVDLTPLLQDLFLPKWYDYDLMADVIATSKDYFLDLIEHMETHFLDKTKKEFVERLTKYYVEEMYKKKAVFKPGLIGKRIEQDISRIQQFLKDFLQLTQSSVQRYPSLLSALSNIVSADLSNQDVEKNLAILQKFGATPHHIEKLISKRTDLQKDSNKFLALYSSLPQEYTDSNLLFSKTLVKSSKLLKSSK